MNLAKKALRVRLLAEHLLSGKWKLTLGYFEGDGHHGLLDAIDSGEYDRLQKHLQREAIAWCEKMIGRDVSCPESVERELNEMTERRRSGSTKQLVAELRSLLAMPASGEPCPPVGVGRSCVEEIADAMARNQAFAVSRRYVEAIIEQLGQP